MNKRTFLKGLSLAGASLPLHFSGMAEWIAAHDQAAASANAAATGKIPTEAPTAATETTATEDFWAAIRAQYNLKPDYINLENGYYNILPESTLEAFIKHIREVNREGAYYMRTVQYDNKKAAATRLSTIAGCSPDELVITRNTTESLDMIIGGYPWKAGDEAIMAIQDYGAMLNMFRQVELRHGVVAKRLSIPNHPASDAELIDLYEKAITPRTKLIMLSHMVNITGQILPVRKITDMAHSHGVEVMVDGAHSFAQIQHTIPQLGCDYYGASLHKWLSVPLGAGILFVKKEHQAKIWPLLAEGEGIEGMARLNHTGTLPVHTDLAINDAIDFYNALGPERKESRLRYLQQYWTTKVRSIPNVIVNTPADPTRACAIANVGIKGMAPAQLAKTLLDQHRIYTVAIDLVAPNSPIAASSTSASRPSASSPAATSKPATASNPAAGTVQGCRITPNIFTLPEELDNLVTALKAMA